MNRLDELIAKLCPNGVEYKRIDEICDISRGRVMSKDYIQANQGEYPVYSSQTENDGELGKISSFDYEGEYLTWTTDGANAGSVFYRNGRFSITNVCGLLKVNKDDVITRYIYHSLQIEAPTYVNRGMGNPKLMSNVMARIKLAVPPLEVQREIIRILDNFTSLKAELQAELQARKKQYEYYRDELLKSQESIPTKRLGDTCRMKSGKAIKANMLSAEPDNEHLYPCYGGNGIRGYIGTKSHNGQFPIIGRQGALCGNVNYAEGEFYATEHAVVVESLGEYNQRYLFYLLTAMNLNQYKSQGAQPGLAVGNIENLTAPVPTIEIQERIVNVLDNFEKICSDLNIGLPAEIEARQKQYEYYRDALLSFDNSYFVNVERERERDEWHSGLIKLWQYVFGYAPVKLKDIAISIKDGMHNLPKLLFDNGDYPILSAQNIHNGFIDFSTKRYVDINTFLKERRRTNIESGDVLLTIVATIGRTAIIKDNTDFLLQRSVCVIKPKRCVLPSYLKYYLDTSKTQAYMQSNAHGSAQAGLYLNQVAEIEIMLPTIQEQERIVSILDRFDSLCNDISSGLPAEIEARQKQYEYYRDKLLSFE